MSGYWILAKKSTWKLKQIYNGENMKAIFKAIKNFINPPTIASKTVTNL